MNNSKYLSIACLLNFILSLCLILYIICDKQKPYDYSNEVIKARGIVITDSLGVERVVISAPIPDPIGPGYRFPRGAKLAGIVLYDSEGIERSGYVTDYDYGLVSLTMDDKTGMHGLFFAEPSGAVSLMMYHGENKAQITVAKDTVYSKYLLNGKNLDQKK